jgi:hypothetical protein
MYSENIAPNSATALTMVAAMRNGEGTVDVEIVEVMNSRSAVASKIKSTRHRTVLFICSPTNLWV